MAAANSSVGVEKALLRFYLEELEPDVKFLVECGHCVKPFYAHKLILLIWSPVFEDQFAKLDETNEIIEIAVTNISAASFEILLKYIYSYQKVLEENQSNVELIREVYEAAEIYQIDELKKSCCEVLKPSSISKTNVFKLLEAAHIMNLEGLKLRCDNFLQNETSEVLFSQEMSNVTTSMILIILNLPSLALPSEYDLILLVYDWAKFEYNKSLESVAPNTIIQPFLPYLNFTLLSVKKFAMLVQKYEEFFDEVECCRILRSMLDCPGSKGLPDWYITPKKSRSYNKVVSSDEESITELESVKMEDVTNDNTLVQDRSFTPVNDCNSSELPIICDCNVGESSSKNESNSCISDSDGHSLNSFNSDTSLDTLTNRSSDSISLNASDIQSACDTSSWEKLEVATCRKKIKKKKVKRIYLLPEGRSLPCSRMWDSSEDSLPGLIWKERHQSIVSYLTV